MTGKSAGRRENVQQVSPVTSKCLAMVVIAVDDSSALNGKEVFDDFQLRNSTCYWNTALSESIRNLQYLGFLEPNTVLLGGSEVCLENLRMAWGRRVLNDPHNCKIEKIGDIGNITMQEVPQNHFIPLPEILCLIILDLNNKQILATVDIVQGQLKKCYQGTQLPSNQLVYETLHSLIQERKIFHTGSGYFVVTPDTLRLPVDLPAPSLQPKHNPMYLPVSSHVRSLPSNHCQAMISNIQTTVAMTQTLPPVRSISCQVSLASQKRSITPEQKILENEQLRLRRSHSARRHRDKGHKETDSVEKDVLVRTQDDCLINRDVNIMESNINKVKEKGEKKSLLSKLFRKKKKIDEVKTKEVKPVVEHATFSAQFPPPEWQWYQEQCKKHERTKDWVTRQSGRASLSHGHTHGVHRHTPENTKDLVHSKWSTPVAPMPNSKHHKSHRHKVADIPHTYHEIESYRKCNMSRQQPQCVQELPSEKTCHPHHKDDHPVEHRMRKSKSHHKKSNRHSVDVGLLRRQHTLQQHEKQTEQMRVPGLSPMYSSTPRDNDRVCSKLGAVEQVNVCSSPLLHNAEQKDREHRPRKRRSKHCKMIENDIGDNNQQRLSHKHRNMAMSRDSGVNCVGLSHDYKNVFCHNQLMNSENIKSNNLHKSMEMQINTLHNEHNKNEIVCIAEINTCVPDRSITTQDREISHNQTEKPSDLDKSEDLGIMDSSEQSYDTVICNKQLQDITKETENMTLGDSGFYSPRMAEFDLNKNKKTPLYKNLIYDHHELNNLKDFQKEKIVLNNEFYKEPSPSSDYQVVGVV